MKAFLQLSVLAVGLFLVTLHLRYNQGLVLMFAGFFFIAIGIITLLVDYGDVTTGRLQAFLKNKIMWGIVWAITLLLLLATVIAGIFTSYIIIN